MSLPIVQYTLNCNPFFENDILSALDNEGSVVVLVMLDFTAAFDTIDHEMYGIHD